MNYWILTAQNNTILKQDQNGIPETYDFFADQWKKSDLCPDGLQIFEDDAEMIRKAFKTARKQHQGQTDKSGTDYIYHPVRVSQLVKGGPQEITVALLHDVIEDTDMTLDDLRKSGFPKAVISGVEAMTRLPGEPREHYLARVKANPIARAVKLADLEHNSDLTRIPNPSARDIARAESYLDEIKYLNERYDNDIVK